MKHDPTPARAGPAPRPHPLPALILALSLLAPLSGVAAGPADQPLGCLIQPDQVAELGSPVIGLLERVHVERGDFVRRGQVLATLSADVEQASLGVARTRAEADADVRAAQADFDYNRQRLARSEDLRRQNFISEQALEQVRAEAEIARQKLAQAQEQRSVWAREFDLARSQVAQRVIRSPFNGVVVERYRYPGERVEEKPVLKLASLDPLRVEVFMPASRYGQIKPGMVLAVAPELPGTESYEAKVARVDRVIDPASNTFRVQLRLPNPRQALPAGLRCKVVLGDKTLREASAKTPARVR